MSDPAIRAALEAAAKMICGGGYPSGCPSCSPDDPCGDHWRNFIPETTAAVAAFLRALPRRDVMLDHPALGIHSTWTLAAAVEEAARDG